MFKYGYWMFLAVLLFAIFGRGAMADELTAVEAMRKMGFSDITVTDKSWFVVGLRGCSQHDAARFTIQAKNPVGEYVTMYVCTGWPWKAATVRS